MRMVWIITGLVCCEQFTAQAGCRPTCVLLWHVHKEHRMQCSSSPQDGCHVAADPVARQTVKLLAQHQVSFK